jgi:hypothetical protein
LADCAASLGISDAGICLNEENSQDTGVVLGTT